MVHKHPLGLKLYVNSKVATAPSGRRTAGATVPCLVVHSHGDQTQLGTGTANVNVPAGLEIKFQVADWNAADDAALQGNLQGLVNNGVFGRRAVHEAIAGRGVIKDYRIYKYQAKGEAGYQEVAAIVDLNGDPPAFDVLSVRNRWTSWRNSTIQNVYISELFAELNNIRHEHGYTTIYCSFCRVLRENPYYRPGARSLALDG